MQQTPVMVPATNGLSPCGLFLRRPKVERVHCFEAEGAMLSPRGDNPLNLNWKVYQSHNEQQEIESHDMLVNISYHVESSRGQPLELELESLSIAQ